MFLDNIRHNSDSSDNESLNSKTNESLMEEFVEEVSGKVNGETALNIKKLRSSFKPIKISFIVGVIESISKSKNQLSHSKRPNLQKTFKLKKFSGIFDKTPFADFKLDFSTHFWE